MRKLRRWYKGVLVAGLLAYGLLVASLFLPLLEIFPHRRAAALHGLVRRYWCRLACRCLNVRVRLTGTPHPDARFWVANHISWLDIIALGAQQPLAFVAKQEVAAWPVLGYMARQAGTLFVRRGDAAHNAGVIEQMVWRLRRGERLLLFPEGTTTRGDSVLRFHARLLAPAPLAQVSVQAIALEYQGQAGSFAPFIGEDEFVPHLLAMLDLDCIDLRVHYCTPIPVGVKRDELAQTARRHIADALDLPVAAQVACAGSRRISP